MLPDAVDPVVPDIVLAAARQPGDLAPSNIYIRDGVVSRITAADELPRNVPVLDLDGRYVIPGLWDEHVHMTQWALTANRIDLSSAGSAREAVEVVRSVGGA